MKFRLKTPGEIIPARSLPGARSLGSDGARSNALSVMTAIAERPRDAVVRGSWTPPDHPDEEPEQPEQPDEEPQGDK